MEKCDGLAFGAHRSGNQESGIEIEERGEEGADDGGEDDVRSNGHHHHPVVCEHEQTDNRDIVKPEELRRSPCEPKH